MLYLALLVGGGLVGALAFLMVAADEESRAYRSLTVGGVVIGFIALTALFSVQLVPTGNVVLLRNFGVIQPQVLQEGLAFKAPWQTGELINVQRQQIDVGSAGTDAKTVSLTADSVDLQTEVVFPYHLNPLDVAPIYSKIGGEERIKQVLLNSAQSALRDAVATLGWEEAAVTNRAKLEERIGENYARVVSTDLQSAGLTATQAKSAVILSNPIIKQAAPPERLTRELQEKQAAVIELGRQKKLTEIAGEVAKRRGAEGDGIAALLSKLPNSSKDFTANEIASVINANANETKAQAVLKAVESGKLGSITFSEQPSTTTNK